MKIKEVLLLFVFILALASISANGIQISQSSLEVNKTYGSDKNVILFDGYPRSIEQMTELDKHLTQSTTIELCNVIEVVVSEAIAKERVCGRSRGADDNLEVFKHRMEVYTEPLVAIQSFYTQKNLLHKIDGERELETIVDDMETFILNKIK